MSPDGFVDWSIEPAANTSVRTIVAFLSSRAVFMLHHPVFTPGGGAELPLVPNYSSGKLSKYLVMMRRIISGRVGTSGSARRRSSIV